MCMQRHVALKKIILIFLKFFVNRRIFDICMGLDSRFGIF